MAKAEEETGMPKPKSGLKSTLLLVGVVLVLVGLFALGHGLAPAGAFMDIFGAFGGGAPDPNLGATIEGAMAELKARALWDIVGFIGLLGGIVLAKVGLAKPKPKSVEEQVKDEVEKRMRGVGMPGGGQSLSVSPFAAPTTGGASAAAPGAAPLAAPVLASSPSVAGPRRCRFCSSPVGPAVRHCPLCGNKA